ncbi:MAG: hypothetical protein II702_09475 [Clostridia bacterium]|jgi:predicted acyltransferase (DUF342 family)|nr:hypothetical protein [Clostridia bacterium]
MKRIVSLLLALVLVASSAAVFTSCSGKDKVVEGEFYVGEGMMTMLRLLVSSDLEIVQNIAVHSKLKTDDKGIVTDEKINTYETLDTLFKSVYSADKAEKLIKSAGYSDSDGKIKLGSSKCRDKGTTYDPESIEIQVFSKTDTTCEFTAKVAKTSAKGKTKDVEIDFTAVYENNTWLLADMYY